MHRSDANFDLLGVWHHRGSDPFCEFAATHTTIGNAQNRIYNFRFGCFDLESIKNQEHVRGHKGHPLVPVQEGVVLRETEAILSCEHREIHIGLVGPNMLGSRQRGLEQPGITQPELAAVLAHLVSVQGFNDRPAEPYRLLHGYLDSSRRALRYLAAVRL